MQEKRKFERYGCLLKTRFLVYEGDPESETIMEDTTPRKCKGRILDISKGGLFIASKYRFAINHPVVVEFKTEHEKLTKKGIIIRTGLMENNPSEVVQKYKKMKIKEDAYLAIEFEEPLTMIEPDAIN